MIDLKDISLSTNNQVEKSYSKSISLEHRKKFAQFFTPFQLASLMTDWLLGNQNLNTVLEPAFGLGVFSRALLSKKSELSIKGFDIDETIFAEAKEIFHDIPKVDIHLEDYMFNDWNNKYDGIICNPPYFKFHDYDNKTILNEIENHLKIKLNGFTNIYALFLLKSIYQLNTNGRLAYIIPSEFLNSDYGKLVKSALIKNKILRHIIVFDFKENVFDDALTTACILFCSNDKNYQKVKFSTIKKIDELENIQAYIANYYVKSDDNSTYIYNELDPEIKWRKYYQAQNGIKYKNLILFSSVAKVVRGIATGANEYFIFSKSKASQYGIDEKYLLPCICKAIDVKDNFFTKDKFNSLVNADRQSFLLNAISAKDEKVLKYIEIGEKTGIDKKYLTACRTPWYSLENRPPSPIWVSVFNRSGLKFVRNEANISNLTTFHCVYPVQSSLFDNGNIDILFAYLLTDVAREIFEDNRREYGNGLQKFEPNDLNKAMMLDLTLLDKKTENEIMRLYKKYRETVLNQSSDDSLLDNINGIFKNKYAQ
ncbi:HsdM family class I SAM-dependent methyltransferase [Planktothrix agardhii]|uniref:HsdM family class I SAM-dependent methyltransferase n=1 Tax=Planktothrix agardhii TaxID=1160 RepID=UPI001D0B2F79|nr:Eco57I restriction-modification methylase domain-containing protein [Planktothrix agardhii]MCB8759630.1 Eco57I restriction-modification methylase domain-containing protein [Planktothrix agardhii 1813]